MASTGLSLSNTAGLAFWPAIARLAHWRFKQMWRFLFVTWLGMLVMVVLVCSGPLFELVATGASTRSQLASAPDGAYITTDIISLQPTPSQLQQAVSLTNTAFQQGTLGRYVHNAPQMIIQTPPLDLLTRHTTLSAAIDLVGYDNTLAAQHTTLVKGRLPRTTRDGTVEIALWQDAATNLGLQVGSTVQGQFSALNGSQAWKLHVVGIIAPRVANDPFWAVADPFSKSSISLGSRYYFKHEGASSYNVLASSQALEPKIAPMQATFTGNDFSQAFVILLRYPFDLARFDAYDLPALSQQITTLDERYPQLMFRNLPSGSVGYANIFGTIWPTLEFSTPDGTLGQITITFLLLITLALVLFLVSLMAGVLVEWQAVTIATLRSRGATRQHIFSIFALQGIGVSVAALLCGLPLALLLVSTLAPWLLARDSRSLINVITDHPLAAIQDVQWYALGAAGIALLVLLLALHRAAGVDVITFRREIARPRRVPLWRRFYLDLFLVVLLLVGYGIYAFTWSLLSQATQRIDPVVYRTLTSIGFYAAPLVVPALLLLFLRIFPVLLRLATRLVAKRRSAPAILALAQMERTPRSAARVIVLLALAISSACFFVTLIASQAQRNLDLATFAALGADFSGPLPTSMSSQDVLTTYSHMPGVQGVTTGYQDTIQLSALQDASGKGTLTVTAIDPATYAGAVSWPGESSSSMALSMQQLASHREAGLTQHVVYALVDLATWQRLHLAPGMHFVLPADSSLQTHITYIALAQITAVPGVYDTPSLAWSGMGLVVDYQNYRAAKSEATGKDTATFAPNTIWLRTNGDARTLKRIRSMLPGVNDRYQMVDTLQNDPNYLGLVGVLSLGVGAALVLALVGSLLLSWLSASQRLTIFAVTRALGMEPRQIAAVLFWEQGYIYLLGVLLGLFLGMLLLVFVPPILGALPPGNGLDIGFNVPPIRLAIPFGQIALILGMVTLILLGALLLMARLVSRPSLEKTLRLNED